MINLLIPIIGFVFYRSFLWLGAKHEERGHSVTLENLFLIMMTYIIVMLGFGLIYVILEAQGIRVLVEGSQYITGSFFHHLEVSMYFSAVTLLSVGYGDITPIGLGRWIAVIEALLGYALPAVFVARTVIDFEKNEPTI